MAPCWPSPCAGEEAGRGPHSHMQLQGEEGEGRRRRRRRRRAAAVSRPPSPSPTEQCLIAHRCERVAPGPARKYVPLLKSAGGVLPGRHASSSCAGAPWRRRWGGGRLGPPRSRKPQALSASSLRTQTLSVPPNCPPGRDSLPLAASVPGGRIGVFAGSPVSP